MADQQQQNKSSTVVLLIILVTATTLLVGFIVMTRQQTVGPYLESASPSIDLNKPGVNIAAVGDISCTRGQPVTDKTCQMQKVVDAITAEDPEHVLVLGDLQYDKGSPDDFEQLFKPLWQPLKDKSFAVPGNHEYGTKKASGYFGYWNTESTTSTQAGETGKGYYSTNIGDWHIVALNSNCQEVGGCDSNSLQGLWLKDDLAKNTNRCTLAFWHHPRFTSGRHTDATETAYFWEVLYSDQADVIVNGHDHIYERFAKQSPTQQADSRRGIREFIAGAGGKSLYELNIQREANHEFGDDQNFGYLLLTLRPSSYSWTYKTSGGEVIDQGSSTCSL